MSVPDEIPAITRYGITMLAGESNDHAAKVAFGPAMPTRAGINWYAKRRTAGKYRIRHQGSPQAMSGHGT